MKTKKDIADLLRPMLEKYGREYLVNFNLLINNVTWDGTLSEYVSIPFNNISEHRVNCSSFLELKQHINNLEMKRTWGNSWTYIEVPSDCNDFFHLRIDGVENFYIKWEKYQRYLNLKAFI